VAQWYLVQPVGADGQPMGMLLQGTIAIEHPSGRMERPVDMWASGKPVFAPLITNVSDRPVMVRVNAGLIGAQDCNCQVPPGSTRVHIGYYPLFGNSSVEVTSADGKRASFKDLGPQISDKVAGAVGLRFEAKDFH
jgi:hypothetical protein